MKRSSRILLLLGLGMLSCVWAGFSQDIDWEDLSRGILNVRAILVDPDQPEIIYAGTDNSVFKSEDNGKSWKRILSVRGENKAVNLLAFGPKTKNLLYAATGNGLFYSANEGKTWVKIFRGKNYLENQCTAVAILPYALYLGTKAGLFASRDNGRTWQRADGKLSTSNISSIAYHIDSPDYIYAGSSAGVFRTQDKGKSWERIFTASSGENDSELEEAMEDSGEEAVSQIRYITLDKNNPNYLYLGTSRGIYASRDKGETWELFPDYGLLSREIKSLFISHRSILYALTNAGIFEFKNGRWQELSLRLSAGEINFLNIDAKDNFYAACSSGLFKAKTEYSTDTKQENITAWYYRDEPKISAVQQAAIEYAEVQPQKIMSWRKQAAQKAFLPKLTAGINRDASDLWHWESGSTTKTGDDLLVRGQETVDWDVSLTWDLGEVVWNNIQNIAIQRGKDMHLFWSQNQNIRI